MKIHPLLVHELSARLGDAHAEDARHSWHVEVGSTRVNVVVDLPKELQSPRLWLFDPRHHDDSVRQFHVDTLQELDSVVSKVVASMGRAR